MVFPKNTHSSHDEDINPGDFLLAENDLHDCHFNVGSTSPEYVGGVKAVIMAHSPKLRHILTYIDDSKTSQSVLIVFYPFIYAVIYFLHNVFLKYMVFFNCPYVDAKRNDKLYEAVEVPDTQPEVFKLMLRHMYGCLDETVDMPPDTALQVAIIADRYGVLALRRKAIQRLVPSSVDNLFPALKCLMTLNADELHCNVVELIQQQTKKVLESENFLDLDEQCVVFIVSQEQLQVVEVELWRALVKWAKHKGQTEQGPVLRKLLKEPIKHVRFLTLTTDELQEVVATTDILTSKEIYSLGKAILSGTLVDLEGLAQLSQVRTSEGWILKTKVYDNDLKDQNKKEIACHIGKSPDIKCLNYRKEYLQSALGQAFKHVLSVNNNLNNDIDSLNPVNSGNIVLTEDNVIKSGLKIENIDAVNYTNFDTAEEAIAKSLGIKLGSDGTCRLVESSLPMLDSSSLEITEAQDLLNDQAAIVAQPSDEEQENDEIAVTVSKDHETLYDRVDLRHDCFYQNWKISYHKIITLSREINLTRLFCSSRNKNSNQPSYKCECDLLLEIKRQNDFTEVLRLKFEERVWYRETFNIKFNVCTLKANSEYRLQLKFADPHPLMCRRRGSNGTPVLCTGHGSQYVNIRCGGFCSTHVFLLEYTVKEGPECSSMF